MKNLGDVFQLSQGLRGHCATTRLAAPFMLSDLTGDARPPV